MSMLETVMLLMHMSIFVGFTTLAMRRDVAERRISNRLVTTMGITGVVSLSLMPLNSIPLLPSLGVAIIVLCAGWLLNILGFVGGGDAKLAAASSIWLGPSATTIFIPMAMFIGGIQAIFTILITLAMAYRAVPGARFRLRLIIRKISLPYAVSIGTAAVIAMALQIGAII